MSGHTKGRLRLDRGQVITESGDLLRTNGTRVPMVAGPDRLESLANMQRIVALWNAAEELGLTTEAIEAGAIQNLAKGCRVGLSRAQEMREATDDAVADTGIWGLGNEALADDIDIMDCALAQCRALTKGGAA